MDNNIQTRPTRCVSPEMQQFDGISHNIRANLSNQSRNTLSQDPKQNNLIKILEGQNPLIAEQLIKLFENYFIGEDKKAIKILTQQNLQERRETITLLYEQSKNPLPLDHIKSLQAKTTELLYQHTPQEQLDLIKILKEQDNEMQNKTVSAINRLSKPLQQNIIKILKRIDSEECIDVIDFLGSQPDRIIPHIINLLKKQNPQEMMSVISELRKLESKKQDETIELLSQQNRQERYNTIEELRKQQQEENLERQKTQEQNLQLAQKYQSLIQSRTSQELDVTPAIKAIQDNEFLLKKSINNLVPNQDNPIRINKDDLISLSERDITVITLGKSHFSRDQKNRKRFQNFIKDTFKHLTIELSQKTSPEYLLSMFLEQNKNVCFYSDDNDQFRKLDLKASNDLKKIISAVKGYCQKK